MDLYNRNHSFHIYINQIQGKGVLFIMNKNETDLKKKQKSSTNAYDDGNIPHEDLPQDIIPDEVPRKDGPGGESGQ